MLTIDGAKEIIETYGPNRSRWPASVVPAVDQLVQGDDELAAYLKRQRKIDKLLSKWTEEVDGAHIDLDEDDSDYEEQDDPDPDYEGEDEDEDGDEDEDIGPDQGLRKLPDEDEDEELAPITLDHRELSDMDQMFADAIQALIEQAVGNFNVFSRDRDSLDDIHVPEGVSLEDIDQAVMKAVGPLMKDLRRMIAARSQVRRIPGKRSGRLHAPSLHRIKVGDDRVFSRKEEAQSLNTAITLLIDCSGSMSGARMKLATETAYALGTVLNKLGITFECIGFTDDYNKSDREWLEAAHEAHKIHPIARYMPLSMAKFKTFDERWTIPTMRRFAHVRNQRSTGNMGSTPEGCGLEFAAKRLLGRSEERKILICMTDGEPGAYALDHSPGLFVKQSRDMVASIAAAGVDIVGVGIQHAGPTGYYPNSLVINTVEEMPKLLMGVLKKFIVG